MNNWRTKKSGMNDGTEKKNIKIKWKNWQKIHWSVLPSEKYNGIYTQSELSFEFLRFNGIFHHFFFRFSFRRPFFIFIFRRFGNFSFHFNSKIDKNLNLKILFWPEFELFHCQDRIGQFNTIFYSLNFKTKAAHWTTQFIDGQFFPVSIQCFFWLDAIREK